MRIGFVCLQDPDDPKNVSGMLHAIKQQLARRADVVNILPRRSIERLQRKRTKSRIQSLLPGPILRLSRSIADRFRGTSGTPVQEPDAGTMLSRAAHDTQDIQAIVDSGHFDVLFACLCKTLLYGLETSIPIVSFSDATARIINTTYPQKVAFSQAFKDAADELEREALARTDEAIFATSVACRSAVEDYGFEAEHVHTIPMGANLGPEAPSARVLAPPTKESIRFCITAADPIRKRLGLAIDVVDQLRAHGWNATLTYVGPANDTANSSSSVTHAGRLRLDDAGDRRKYYSILADSHFMILPSIGEAFGIAVVEANLVGTPGIVAAAGGLSEVVRDQETGLVLPVAAEANAYVEALERFLDIPDRYTSVARAAQVRAEDIFTWDHFGARAWEIVEGAATAAHPA